MPLVPAKEKVLITPRTYKGFPKPGSEEGLNRNVVKSNSYEHLGRKRPGQSGVESGHDLQVIRKSESPPL